jgi:hypothetical protein
MNKHFKKERNEARGTHLLQEFNDAMFRIESLDERHAASCARNMVARFRNLQETFGPLTNISSNVITELAHVLREEAKNCFEFDLGRGYGIVLLSLFLESTTLPGGDAKYVHDYLTRFLDSPKLHPYPD